MQFHATQSCRFSIVLIFLPLILQKQNGTCLPVPSLEVSKIVADGKTGHAAPHPGTGNFRQRYHLFKKTPIPSFPLHLNRSL